MEDESAISRSAPSQRDVVVLFPGVGERLIAQHRERAAESLSGVARQDHVVDKTAACRDKWIGEFLAVFLGARLDCRWVPEVGAEDDLDGTLGAHYRNLSRGPCEIHVAAQMLRAHHV